MTKANRLLPLVSSALLLVGVAAAQDSWRYYRPGNTGIQGDYCEALWVGPDGDPWIGGYQPSFEEGGIAKLVQSENRWINVSNVDYPVIGHPDLTGTSRVSDIVADAAGRLWMATGRGALLFDPQVGPSSLVKFDPSNSTLGGGWTTDVELAPDGTLWFAGYSTAWGAGSLARFDPASSTWSAWSPLGTRLAAQPKPGGGYSVWNGEGTSSSVQRFDSSTQQWTLLPNTGAIGEVVGLPGEDCTDDAGNLWLLRSAGAGNHPTLEYRRIDGSWVAPPVPFPEVGGQIWVLRAFGDRQALLVDGSSRTWRFDGNAWTDLGVWRPGSWTYAADIDAAGNVWVSGIGGAARRDAETGQWQRYRVTNTSNFDSFNRDLTIDPSTGDVYTGANAAPGVGGMVRFDGQRWTGWDQLTYGLGHDWPFQNDSCTALAFRPSTGRVAVSPLNWLYGIHEWNGSGFAPLPSLTGAERMCEDSLGRLWALGEYYNLNYHDGLAWNPVSIAGWGFTIRKDPTRPGTIWAITGYEAKRTDGAYSFSRTVADFPELTTQSDRLMGVAPDADGVAWIGCTVQLGAGGTGGGLIRIDANTGSYQMLRQDQGWPFPGRYVTPWAVTPDGRLWMQYDTDYPYTERGLCWYDGTNVGAFPAPPGGEPQWGGLPHAQIEDVEVREVPGGYELWMSCVSRGIAVLTHLTGDAGTPFCLGDGSTVDCPCGPTQNGAAGEGCLNSFGTGATLSGAGLASVSADSLRLDAAGLPPSTTVLFFQYDAGAPPSPFGDGLTCAGGPVVRMRAAVASGGQASIGSGLTAPISVLGGVPAGGGLRHYQGWYRNQQAFCTPAAFNTTGGLSVDWQP